MNLYRRARNWSAGRAGGGDPAPYPGLVELILGLLVALVNVGALYAGLTTLALTGFAIAGLTGATGLTLVGIKSGLSGMSTTGSNLLHFAGISVLFCAMVLAFASLMSASATMSKSYALMHCLIFGVLAVAETQKSVLWTRLSGPDQRRSINHYSTSERCWQDTANYSPLRALSVVVVMSAAYYCALRFAGDLLLFVGVPVSPMLVGIYSQTVLAVLLLFGLFALRVLTRAPADRRWLGLAVSHWPSPGRLLGWSALKGAGLGLLVALVYFGLIIPVYSSIAGNAGYTGTESASFLRNAGGGYWVGQFLLAVGVAPLVEETFFRGLIFGYVRRVMSRWLRDRPSARAARVVAVALGIVFSAPLFGLAHGFPSALGLATMLGGVVFCIVYERSGSLWITIFAHATINLIVTVVLIAGTFGWFT